jgi:hypothetical protein
VEQPEKSRLVDTTAREARRTFERRMEKNGV